VIATCHTRCWDAGKARRYSPGDTDDINPLDPIGKYFTFPPGTEKYRKRLVKDADHPKGVLVTGTEVEGGVRTANNVADIDADTGRKGRR
jgi:hypothetical protein